MYVKSPSLESFSGEDSNSLLSNVDGPAPGPATTGILEGVKNGSGKDIRKMGKMQ